MIVDRPGQVGTAAFSMFESVSTLLVMVKFLPVHDSLGEVIRDLKIIEEVLCRSIVMSGYRIDKRGVVVGKVGEKLYAVEIQIVVERWC